MSETKFMPGPWEAKSNNPAKEFTWLVYNRAHSQWPIAVEMKEADAHLIAAAPDMHEALEAILSGVSGAYNPKRCTVSKSAIEMACQALAKAEGKAG